MSAKQPVAILIGHSRGDGGALSTGGVNEWTYNKRVGILAADLLSARGVEAVCIYSYAQASYATAMAHLAKHLRSIGARAAVELHFNSATPTARGNEWLHWHSSVAGRALAQCLDKSFQAAFPTSLRRGLKPIAKPQDRGGLFLRGTHCPAVIAEPFFGSNAMEWTFFADHQQEYAEALADGIQHWLGGPSK
jgi:N-acetylmuramoyl-L-alanine amidase